MQLLSSPLLNIITLPYYKFCDAFLVIVIIVHYNLKGDMLQYKIIHTVEAESKYQETTDPAR